MKTLFSAFFLSLLSAQAEWKALVEEDRTSFPNPERGFYSHQNLADPNRSWSRLRQQDITLLAGKLLLEPYREAKTLPEDYLQKVQAGFTQARKDGLKVVVRVNYGHRGPGGDYTTYEDPDPAILLSHIRQLAPVWEENADVIALFEAGFVGPWGEWHSTKIARDLELQRQFFFEILDHTPESRMVVLRYPELKRGIFQRRRPLEDKEAHKPTKIARTGHHNDCFLSSPNDVGTYGRGDDSRDDEVEYLAVETRFTVYGGESCALHELNDAERTLAELDLLNASYLNSGYHPEVLAKWKSQGCHAEVSRRLGSRFHVSDATVDASKLRLTIDNLGFASLYNERPVFLMRAKGDTLLPPQAVEVDPRSWKSGDTVELKITAALDGVTRLGLWMPDQAKALRKDSRFSIRFANKASWDDKQGVNWIMIKE